MPSIDLLQTCVQALKHLTGAARVSLYVPADGSQSEMLLHDAERPAVPELADEAEARAFCRRVDGEAAEGAGSPRRGVRAGLLRVLDSGSDRGRLIRISSPESLPDLLYRETHDGEPPARRSTDVAGSQL